MVVPKVPRKAIRFVPHHPGGGDATCLPGGVEFSGGRESNIFAGTDL